MEKANLTLVIQVPYRPEYLQALGALSHNVHLQVSLEEFKDRLANKYEDVDYEGLKIFSDWLIAEVRAVIPSVKINPYVDVVGHCQYVINFQVESQFYEQLQAAVHTALKNIPEDINLKNQHGIEFVQPQEVVVDGEVYQTHSTDGLEIASMAGMLAGLNREVDNHIAKP